VPSRSIAQQCLYQRAIRPVAGIAFGDQIGERGLHRAQIVDLGQYVGQMFACDGFHLITGAIPLIDETQQGAHFVQREAQLPGAADEAETFDMGGAVGPVAALGASGFGQHADLFIEPDCFDVAARTPRECADREERAGCRSSFRDLPLNLELLQIS